MKLELRHLTPYLPYDLKVWHNNTLLTLCSVEKNIGVRLTNGDVNVCESFSLSEIRPILRPLSSMTVEEVEELNELIDDSVKVVVSSGNWVYIESASSDPWDGSPTLSLDSISIINEYLFKNHFDVFGLIDNNLAIAK